MNVTFHKTFELAGRTVAFAFGLWLAGAGCAFCCATTDDDTQTRAGAAAFVAHGDQAPDASSAPAHCPLHEGASKVAAGEPGGAVAFVQTPSLQGNHAGSCCGKARPPADPARKLNPSMKPAATDARAEFSRGDGALSAASSPAARGRSPDKRSAHLRGCVFLI